MKKKGILILASVVVICALGLVLSPLMDWNVNSDQTSGNIGKTSRFSRKTAVEGVSNMQELLLNDEAYKNGVVAGYVVMQTRAKQFDALVDLSNQAAGGISEFDAVLKDMNDIRPTIDNVCASLTEAGNDINAALGGQNRPDLAQNTINASLAYTTLQKQNKLADRFITTTDNYLKNADGSEQLKFVRDQWVNYQQMTAALNNDTKAAAELEKKGYTLTPEQTANALNNCYLSDATVLISNAYLCNTLDVDNNLSNVLTNDVFQHAVLACSVNDVVSSTQTLGEVVNDMVSNSENLSNITNEVISNETIVRNIVNETISNITNETVSNITNETVSNITNETVSNITNETVSNITNETVSNITNETVSNITNEVVSFHMLSNAVLGNSTEIMKSFDQVVIKNAVLSNSDVMRNSSDVMRNSSDVMRNSSDVMRNSSDVMRNSSDVMRNSSDVMRNSSDVMRNSINDAIKNMAVGNQTGVGFLVKDL